MIPYKLVYEFPEFRIFISLLYLLAKAFPFLCIRQSLPHINPFSRTIFKSCLVLLSVAVFAVPAFATRNPSVSHSAAAGGTFQDNYTFISYAENATPIVIRGNDTQLANLTVWQTFAGVPLASINATGSWHRSLDSESQLEVTI